MDKRILTASEINYIRQFIKSKGFTDTAVIIEILDHTACKVEDILTNNPKVQFEEAVRMAHHSFGVKGFATLAADYEHHLKEKYRLIYWSYFKKILQQPLYSILFILIGVLTFKIFVHTYLHGIIAPLGYNYVELMLMFMGVCFEGYIFEMIRKGHRGNLIMTTARSRGILSYTLFMYLIILPPLSHYKSHYVVLGIVYSLMIVAIVINFLARYKTMEEAKEECSCLHEM